MQGPPRSGVPSPSLITSAHPTCRQGGVRGPGSQGVGTWTHGRTGQHSSGRPWRSRADTHLLWYRGLAPSPLSPCSSTPGGVPSACTPLGARLPQTGPNAVSPGPTPRPWHRPTLSAWGIKAARLASPRPWVWGSPVTALLTARSAPGRPLLLKQDRADRKRPQGNQLVGVGAEMPPEHAIHPFRKHEPPDTWQRRGVAPAPVCH